MTLFTEPQRHPLVDRRRMISLCRVARRLRAGALRPRAWWVDPDLIREQMLDHGHAELLHYFYESEGMVAAVWSVPTARGAAVVRIAMHERTLRALLVGIEPPE